MKLRNKTIEGVHDVLKNELAAGVLPCGRFGANAAWLRMAILTHNVLTALKRLALPAELLPARPKRLRFLIFHTAGRLAHHARKIVLRLCTRAERLASWLGAMRLLPLPRKRVTSHADLIDGLSGTISTDPAELSLSVALQTS